MEKKKSSATVTKDEADYAYKIYKYDNYTYAAFTTSGKRITPNVSNLPFYCGGGVFLVRSEKSGEYIYIGYDESGKQVFPASMKCSQIFHGGNGVFKVERLQGGEKIYAAYNAEGQCIIPFTKQYRALYIYPQYNCIWVDDASGASYTYTIDGSAYAEGRLYLNTEKGRAEFDIKKIMATPDDSGQNPNIASVRNNTNEQTRNNVSSYTQTDKARRTRREHDFFNEEELRFPHHYSELIGSYQDGQFFVGANYTYIPQRWGFYGSFMYGFKGGYSLNVGPTLRLTNGNSTSVDIHLFQGIGVYSGHFEGETGMRFGFGRDREYGMWSLSGSLSYSAEGLGWTVGVSWPIAFIVAVVAGNAASVSNNGNGMFPYKPTYNNTPAYTYGDGTDAAIANANRIMQQSEARMQYEMANAPQMIMQQTNMQMAAQEAAKEAQWRQDYERYKNNPGFALNEDGSLYSWEQYKAWRRQIEAQAYMEMQQEQGNNLDDQEYGTEERRQRIHAKTQTTESACPHCFGTSDCQICGGDGWMDGIGKPNGLKCSSCGDTKLRGKCKFCHGTGKKVKTKVVVE